MKTPLKKMKEMKLEESRKIIVISNEASQRINTEEIGGNNKISPKIKKEKKIKIDPSLTPKPIEVCENYFRFSTFLERDLKNFCSYGYRDSQFSHFKISTNHLIAGTIIGGVILGFYLDSENNLKKELFREAPVLNISNYTFAVALSFACLYPPDNKELWKKYAVCTSSFNGDFVASNQVPPANFTHGMFTVIDKSSEKESQPYCVVQTSFKILCNMVLSSFVKYLPSEEGWVDVQEESVNVFTQIKLFVGSGLYSYDFAVRDEFLDKARVIIGNPQINGNELGDYNTLNLDTYYSKVQPHYEEDWNKLSDGGTLVFNDYAYLCNFSASPTDYEVINEDNSLTSNDKKEKLKKNEDDNSGPLVNTLYKVRMCEAAHNLSNFK